MTSKWKIPVERPAAGFTPVSSKPTSVGKTSKGRNWTDGP
jgi:hypothetical protein